MSLVLCFAKICAKYPIFFDSGKNTAYGGRKTPGHGKVWEKGRFFIHENIYFDHDTGKGKRRFKSY